MLCILKNKAENGCYEEHYFASYIGKKRVVLIHFAIFQRDSMQIADFSDYVNNFISKTISLGDDSFGGQLLCWPIKATDNA